MILQDSSDIIQGVESLQARGIEVLHFRDGKVLAISHNTLAFFSNRGSLDDPLGNGLLSSCEIPAGVLPKSPPEWVKEYQAGYVGLSNEHVLLITPVAIQLFRSKEDALSNQNAVSHLALPCS